MCPIECGCNKDSVPLISFVLEQERRVRARCKTDKSKKKKEKMSKGPTTPAESQNESSGGIRI
jgi:hypothetical protein